MLGKTKAPSEILQDQGRVEEPMIPNCQNSRRRRLQGWCRVLVAVAEQREALNHRIWRAEPHDTNLLVDVQIWCELSGALADFLEARRAA